MQQQDQQVDQVAVTVKNLREIGEVMGNELDDQTRFKEIFLISGCLGK